MVKEKYEIHEWNSKALAAQVVVYRALGINKQLSIDCMTELLLRERLGDNFDYNLYIEHELAKMPERPLNQDMTGLFGSIMDGVKGLRDMVNGKN